MPEAVKKSTRLSREARHAMILDKACEIVAEEGVSKVTMEALGKRAGVSKSLIYAYFPSVTEVLKELLEREYRRVRRMQLEAANSAETVEQLVRRVTRAYLGYIGERGLIIERLSAEPSVADPGGPTEYLRDQAVDYVAKILVDTLGIDREVALMTADISFGLPAAAGNYLTRHDVNPQTIEDVTVMMILGSIETVRQRYDFSVQPIKRGKSKPKLV